MRWAPVMLVLIWLAALVFFWSAHPTLESNLHLLASIILSYLVLWGLAFVWSNAPRKEMAQRFLLTLHIMDKPANPGVLHFWIDDVDEWYSYVKSLNLDEREYECGVAEPVLEDWGWRIMYIWAPSGLLMHFAEPHTEENKKFFREAEWMDG